MAGICVIEGPLSKWTNMMKGWQYRWFVLDDNVGLLSYYTSREKRMRGERRGCVRLQGAVIGIDDEDESTFTITVDQKTFHFQAKHSDEKEQWINCLESVIMKVSQPRLQYFAHNLGSPLSTSMSDFDRKLAEADAYLKILIDQIQDLQRRILSFPTSEDSLREKFVSLKTSAEVMVESIKQTIVFLQISKHNIMHINTPSSTSQTIGHFSTPIIKPCDKPSVAATLTSTFNNFTASAETLINGVLTEVSTHRSAECLVDSYAVEAQQVDLLENLHHHHHHLQPLGQANHSTLSNSLPNLLTPSDDFQDVTCQETFPKMSRDKNLVQDEIPDESFSSSDDDERYYDAEDQTREANTDKGKSPPKVSGASNANVPLSSEDEDSEDDGKMESMANHGSLLTHLLGQLHIGMDLTKVTLPTFILEKRSLLEMYSDFMSHPDLFVSIADQKTPKERFLSTVRWYLSAFHAGKKSGVAKKPYNPILGECFKCFYELPQKQQQQQLENGDQDLDKDGPIPWSTKSNLSFVAEQVSHHPPISAFYGECYRKRISINGYVWTKSKFLGLSVGVHMIGQAVISVLEHDEDYIVTFPNGYGRSILTVPWMELGGKVSITCSKTGYNANIDFHTKPFYGGKKDQVSADLFGPNDKKAFANIKGEWNGTMHIKTGLLTEMFLDTRAIPVIKKQVKPIDQQEPNESRRLWRSVTINLKTKDIEKATDFKCRLEQQQREEAKARKEAGQKFETKLFHEVGAHWVFDKPLVSRVHQGAPTPTRTPFQSTFSSRSHSPN